MARKTSFYYSFLTLDRERRAGIIAVFDFCRAVDDSVDAESDPARAADAVALWRREVDLIFGGGQPATPQGRALQLCVRPFQMSREPFDALVDGVEMDTTSRVYETFAELEPYCHRVASAVGLMCLYVFGVRGAAADAYARDLGVALQLTNILRDVGVDMANGRVYVPIEDLTRFGCTVDDIRAAVANKASALTNERLRAVLEHQGARARVFFSRAVRALPEDDRMKLLPAEIMRAIYWALLERITEARYDVFPQVIRVPRPTQARLALAAWWKGRRGGRASRPDHASHGQVTAQPPIGPTDTGPASSQSFDPRSFDR